MSDPHSLHAPVRTRVAGPRPADAPSSFAERRTPGRFDDAVERLLALLDAAATGFAGPTDPAGAHDPSSRASWGAHAWRLLSDARLVLSPAQSSRLCARHRELTELLAGAPEGEPGDLAPLFASAPALALRAWLGLLSNPAVFTEEAAERRRRLLALAPAAAEGALSFEELPLLAPAWFLCGFDAQGDQHAARLHLNRIVRRALSSIGLRDEPLRPRPPRVRPRLLVPVERFTAADATFRRYGPHLARLRAHFELVLVATPEAVDDTTRALFDREVPLGGTRQQFREAVQEIRALAPDIAWFPSVGTSTEGIALASLRHAPVQVASLGHPVTTMMPTIDHMVLPEEWVDAADRFSEGVVCVAPGRRQVARHPEWVPLTPAVRGAEAEEVRAAVSCDLFELNPRFLEACRTIVARAARPVRLVFFVRPSGETCPDALRADAPRAGAARAGAALAHARPRLEAWFPGCEVHAYTDHPSYLRRLNGCDLQLSPFPFGAAERTLDALLCAVPTVTLEGAVPQARADAAMLRLAGAPGWCIAPDEAAYVAAALRLVDDGAERSRLRRQLAAGDLDALCTDRGFAHEPDDLVELMRWLHESRERIRRDGRRVWHVRSRGDAASRDRAIAAVA